MTQQSGERPYREYAASTQTRAAFGVLLTYAFEIGSDMYGGDSKLKGLRGVSTYAQDRPITVAYDPLNPTESRIITSERNR